LPTLPKLQMLGAGAKASTARDIFRFAKGAIPAMCG
jgi:hypothetical protein